jgi:3-hydroxyethyl bacteriochlorophyllide a dehydrogenase
MDTIAVVLKEPERLVLRRVDLADPGDKDVVVDMEWTGISTGTEKLLWSGKMPPFPGMGYPLIPGYESVGRVRAVGARSGGRLGDRVFVPGARCFGRVRGLFGGAAARVVVPGDKIVPIGDSLGEKGVLIALAATAYHAIFSGNGRRPDLIVGHGVLGRLIARLAVIGGDEPPVVWERNPDRALGAVGYTVIQPGGDKRRDYRAIYDASGDAALVDTLIGRLAHGGELTLAGFYPDSVSFQFPPAFMREARIRIAAEWQPADLAAVRQLIGTGELSLDGLITHCRDATEAPDAYRTAFTDPACLKMILDWRTCQ